MSQVHGQHLCHPRDRILSPFPPEHQLLGPTHSIYYWGPQGRWFHTLPGHPSFSGIQQHPYNYSVAQTNPHDQYLHWDSNNFLMAKHIVYNTLTQRARIACKSPHALQQEEDHVRQALLKHKFCHGPSPIYIPSFITGYTLTTHTWQKTHNTTTVPQKQQEQFSSIFIF